MLRDGLDPPEGLDKATMEELGPGIGQASVQDRLLDGSDSGREKGRDGGTPAAEHLCKGEHTTPIPCMAGDCRGARHS